MTNLYGMTDDELLDCLGPSWNEMTQAERDAYGQPAAPDLVLTRDVKATRKPRRTLTLPDTRSA